jgi:hypothetical protein
VTVAGCVAKTILASKTNQPRLVKKLPGQRNLWVIDTSSGDGGAQAPYWLQTRSHPRAFDVNLMP